MCGIIGVTIDNPTEKQIEIIKRSLIETQIRGKHASGISWYDGSELQCIKRGVPISELIRDLNVGDLVYKDGENSRIRMIAHIRYSTSDIHYHQPLGSKEFGYISHNGVIDQDSPDIWKERYGYECETKNDSELIYHCIKSGENPIEKFPNASISALFIDRSGNVVNFRNGLRPQWVCEFDNGRIYASTRNILLRAGCDENNVRAIESMSGSDKQIRNMEMDYAKKR